MAITLSGGSPTQVPTVTFGSGVTKSVDGDVIFGPSGQKKSKKGSVYIGPTGQKTK